MTYEQKFNILTFFPAMEKEEKDKYHKRSYFIFASVKFHVKDFLPFVLLSTFTFRAWQKLHESESFIYDASESCS